VEVIDEERQEEEEEGTHGEPMSGRACTKGRERWGNKARNNVERAD